MAVLCFATFKLNTNISFLSLFYLSYTQPFYTQCLSIMVPNMIKKRGTKLLTWTCFARDSELSLIIISIQIRVYRQSFINHLASFAKWVSVRLQIFIDSPLSMDFYAKLNTWRRFHNFQNVKWTSYVRWIYFWGLQLGYFINLFHKYRPSIERK